MEKRNQRKIRLIARLDVKSENVVKGVHLEGLRIVGKPDIFAKEYSLMGIDELIYVDSVASLYGRNSLEHIIKKAAQEISVPITVEGGIRSLDDISRLLDVGADKVGINTAAVNNPTLIYEAAKKFGSQCIVLSIAALRGTQETWEAYTDNAREKTGLNALDWAMKGEELGAGEILLTSIDQEGTNQGFDLELCRMVASRAGIPVVASGGAGNIQHIIECVEKTEVSGVAIASILHYKNHTIRDIRDGLKNNQIAVRDFVESSVAPLEKTKEVTVLDYGVGNLFSLIQSLQKINVKVKVTQHAEDILTSERIILPGVGSFQEAMRNLELWKLVDPIKNYAKSGRPLLGICLGAQLLLSSSEEFGSYKGLDLIGGSVVPIEKENRLKIPHVGWNSLIRNASWENTVLNDQNERDEVYFVHSFKMMLERRENLLASAHFGKQEMGAVLKKENVVGCQFHPEKSGNVGLSILKKFMEI